MSPITRREFLSAPVWLPFFGRRRALVLAGIPFEVLSHGKSDRRYVVIHGDEDTARQVLRAHIRGAGRGIAYLVSGRQRDLQVDGALLDPNRIFSREGAEANLRRLNPTLSLERVWSVLDRLDREREALVEALLPPHNGLLIALHNNRDSYSALDEVPISEATALNDREHPHEFFLCTAEADFRALRRSPYNVLLQNVAPKQDDGSLSRLAARRRARYVNIEAALGNLRKQVDMLGWLERNVGPVREQEAQKPSQTSAGNRRSILNPTRS